jgi:hypothetical protein
MNEPVIRVARRSAVGRCREAKAFLLENDGIRG